MTPTPAANLLHDDLDHVLAHTAEVWRELRGQRIFITGGTGCFGCWLLESFLWANEKLDLHSSAMVLTRNPEAFRKKAPHLANSPAIELCRGDVRDFSFPDGRFNYVIHAATEASAALIDEQPLLMFDTIVQGTRRALDFAVHCGARKFLLTSSGAVYGKHLPDGMTRFPEDYCGAPDQCDPHSAYGEGKRAAELLCAIYSSHAGLECKIARSFALVGPYLPLDIHYAIGNFIRDGLAGHVIEVKGDGTPVRSYLYAADLAIWLWTILCRGESARPYNMGSEMGLPIREIALAVADAFHPTRKVVVLGQRVLGIPANHYVPSTQRAQSELGLQEHFELKQSIRRTIAWHQHLNCLKEVSDDQT